MLKVVLIDENYPDMAKVEALNTSAFPPDEQIELEKMLRLSGDPETTFQLAGLYDGERFVGFVWYRVEDTYLYYAFIAIEEGLRHQGYGHQVFEVMEAMYPNRGAIVEMEPVDPQAENYTERLSRQRFYSHNGFLPTKYLVSYYGCTFAVYYKGSEDIIEDFHQMFLSNPGFHPVFTTIE